MPSPEPAPPAVPPPPLLPAIRRVGLDALTTHELYELLRLRSSVFVVEQTCPYPDIDGRDANALHLIATDRSGNIAGCARCLPPTGDAPDAPVSFGRLAVDRSHRATGLGRALVAEALSVLAETWPGRTVVIGAQLHLERFYGGFGFRRSGAVYDDFGIAHIDMHLQR
ncbi:GNAT family N-acetyltransferase [Azospirillum picis]|uniref:ElaA protein n=1 Tax=Azospirillum picis TaxID=488438 RepID=A0ABU0MEK7_9PROT|nr:GNAT family N-acetyltransferase [Azospirillum picis]MBP2298032.1 ElaA protein [Azospirillum picis]MDQ0531870.1 ElaA protein [Azospirillum picis]